MSNRLELVAPAGGWDQLIAAVNAGADSVYLGYKRFGARAYADNFDISGLSRAVSYLHQNNKKAYLTINTLIKDKEFEDILSFLDKYLDICQDGLIIADIGLVKAIKDIFGPVRLHASTQMNIHNLKSAMFLKDLGFSRVVTARELSIKDIREIIKSGLEVEVFGHGSQCFSFSGQCLFSSYVGGRSGNRGRCPQPCRMRYSLVANDGRYITRSQVHILSKDDLYTLDILPEIIKSGVYALKIEGRMKSADYVGIVVKTYRKYIDLYYDKGPDIEHYEIDPIDKYKLKQIFSRDFSGGYFDDDFCEDVISGKKGSSVGNFIGRIKDLSYKDKRIIFKILIKSKWPINKGDVLEIWTNKGNERIKVNKIEKTSSKENGWTDYSIGISKDIKLSVNDRVFKFSDIELEKEAKKFYAEKISIKTRERKKEGSIRSEVIKDYLNISSVHKQRPRKIEVIAVLKDESVLEGAIRSGIKKVVMDIKDLDEDSIEKIVSSCRGSKVEIFFSTPVIIYDKNMGMIKKKLSRCIKDGTGIEISNYSLLRDFKDKGIPILAGQALNLFNSHAVFKLVTYMDSLSAVELSPELNLEELSMISTNMRSHAIKDLGLVVYGYGNNQIMTSRYKEEYFIKKYGRKKDIEGLKGGLYIEDRKRYRFLMKQETDSLNFFNSKKTCMLFDLDKIFEKGIDYVKVDTRSLVKEDAVKLLDIFNMAAGLLPGAKNKYFKLLKSCSDDRLLKDYSKGHLYRGVE